MLIYVYGSRPRWFDAPPPLSLLLRRDWPRRLANERRRCRLGALYPGDQCTAGRVSVRIVSIVGLASVRFSTLPRADTGSASRDF